VPLVVALHAMVVLGAWRAVEPRPGPVAAAPPMPTDTAPAKVRELRLVASPPQADVVAMRAPGAGPAGATEAAAEAPQTHRTVASASPTGAPGDVAHTPQATPASGTAAPLPTPAAPAAPAPPPAMATTVDPAPGPTHPSARIMAAAAPPTPAASEADAVPVRAPTPALATTPVAAARDMPQRTDLAPEAGAGPAPGLADEPARPAGSPSRPAEAPAAATPPTSSVASRPTHPGAAVPASLPVYRGEVPPAATLHFSLRRGAVSGRGQLDWRPAPEGYELSLQATVLGVRALQQTSRGHWDLGGLAPERFVDTRRGREARAANFRHDVGLISYSGPSETYPLVRGAQDRLSWMLHLPAVMQANPPLRTVGTDLRMFVTGARGDGDIWAFRVLSHDRISTPAGEVPRALHLQRLPRKEHDTQADIWLDPARHHLPVRVRLKSGDDVIDLLLDRIEGG
jgi:hypothetical protein